MPRPRIPAEDPVTVPASPEVVYDEMILTGLNFLGSRLIATLTRSDSRGNLDSTDKGLDIVIKDFDSELTRASNVDSAWGEMIRMLAALYRERRLAAKIARRIELGLGTAALEARLASVRTLLGIT